MIITRIAFRLLDGNLDSLREQLLMTKDVQPDSVLIEQITCANGLRETSEE